MDSDQSETAPRVADQMRPTVWSKSALVSFFFGGILLLYGSRAIRPARHLCPAGLGEIDARCLHAELQND